MASRMRFMAAVLALAWFSQVWAAAAEPVQSKRTEAPRPSPEERMAMLRTMASDRWMPQDGVAILERSIRQLELTVDQTQKIRGILQSKDEALTAARKAYADAGKALDESSTNGDDAAIRTAAVKVGQALADLQILRKKVATELKAVLTPEQLKKLDQLKEQARERMQGMREPVRQPRPQGAAGGATTGQATQGQAAKTSQTQPDKKK